MTKEGGGGRKGGKFREHLVPRNVENKEKKVCNICEEKPDGLEVGGGEGTARGICLFLKFVPDWGGSC